MRSSSSSCSGGCSTSSTTGLRRAGSTSARTSATSASTAPSTRRATPSTSPRSRPSTAGTRSRTSGSSSGGSCPTGCSSTPRRRPRRGASPSARSATRRRSSSTRVARTRRTACPPSSTCRGRSAAAFFGKDLVKHQVLPPPDFTDLYGLPSDPGLAAPPTLSDDASLFVISDQTPVLPANIRCRRLDTWPAARPAGAVVWIDPQQGKLALGTGFDATKPLRVFMTFGFPAALGGGAYERRAWLARRDPGVTEYDVRFGAAAPQFPDVAVRAHPVAGRRPAERDDQDPRQPHVRASRRDHALEPAPPDDRGVERRAPAPAHAGGGLRHRRRRGPAARPRAARRADALRAARRRVPPRRRRRRPTAPAPQHARPRARPEGGRHAEEHRPEHRRRARARLWRAHQRAAAHPDRLQRVAARSSAPTSAEGIWLLDSIVDGLGGTALESRAGERVLGSARRRAHDLPRPRARARARRERVDLHGPRRTERTQAGCVRFSFVPLGSRTPRRYRCQPDLGHQARPARGARGRSGR